MSGQRKLKIAVVGATGNVGRQVLSLLAERDFPIASLDAVASAQSAGRPISFGESQTLKVKPLQGYAFDRVDLAFFCAGGAISKQYIPLALERGAAVIDKSSCFRLAPQVPLVIPEVNSALLTATPPTKMIANPNCVAIPLGVVLHAINQASPIERVVVSTYQSVSGAGKEAMDELFHQTRAIFANQDVRPQVFKKPIAFNVIPQIGEFEDTGMTGEEDKIVREISKIFHNAFQITVTSVRVPVFIGHSMAVNIQLKEPLSPSDARKALEQMRGVMVVDRRAHETYVTPLDVAGEDEIFVSRIRQDSTVPHGLNVWVSCDNLRKGAALNAVQIAEQLAL